MNKRSRSTISLKAKVPKSAFAVLPVNSRTKLPIVRPCRDATPYVATPTRSSPRRNIFCPSMKTLEIDPLASKIVVALSTATITPSERFSATHMLTVTESYHGPRRPEDQGILDVFDAGSLVNSPVLEKEGEAARFN